jgi:hypothetical protein
MNIGWSSVTSMAIRPICSISFTANQRIVRWEVQRTRLQGPLLVKVGLKRVARLAFWAGEGHNGSGRYRRPRGVDLAQITGMLANGGQRPAFA